MAESAEPTQVVYLGWLPPGPAACGLAPGTRSSPSEPFCTAEWLNEEPDMGKPFVRFCEGLRRNWCMAEIGWHRRETRRQTENTNVMPGALEGLILLDKNPSQIKGVCDIAVDRLPSPAGCVSARCALSSVGSKSR